MTGASIIVPVYNALEYARVCVESVYEVQTSMPFEVIVVDNGSTPEVAVWLAKEQEERQHLVVVHFDQPLGFARAVNEGARRARYDTLVLLNSDAIVTDGWLDGLRDALRSDSRLGVVSPLTNLAGNPRQVDQEVSTFNYSQFRGHAARMRDRKEVVCEPERVVFFCVMIRRALWELLAGLEEGYGVGNGEDNDFCLRARLAGYRLAVARNVFVFHEGHTTFRSNGLDHSAWMARNQLLYCNRASRWARSLELPDCPRKQSLPSVSVIVPVKGQAARLRDSLASLANQTVCGFETVIVSPPGEELSNVVQAFEERLRISRIVMDESRGDQRAALLNAGLEAANGQWMAYLPAGDIYYPFHIELLAEVLRNSEAEAVYGAWSVVDRAIEPWNGREHRRAVPTYRTHELGLDNYPPLPCWMHGRGCMGSAGFDESLGAYPEWEFVLRMSKRAKTRYVPRVSYEHRIGPERDVPDPSRVAEAQHLMQTFPAEQAWQQENRAQFLEAVKTGTWEEFPLGMPSSSSQIGEEPGGANVQDTHRQRFQPAGDTLAKAIIDTKCVPNPTGLPDILLFSVIPWDALVQRPQHFARQLAMRGYRVYWVDLRLKPPELVDPTSLPKELYPGLFYVELPGNVSELIPLKWDAAVLAGMEMAVAHLRAVCGIHDAIQLVSRPKWGPLVYRLRDRFGWPIVYDCVDDTKAFAAMNQHDGGDFEDEMAQRCDLLVACSRLLYEDRSKHNPKTIQILNAGDYNLFHSAAPAGLLKHLPRPIAGYFGAFSGWLDLDWIEAAARRFPRWSFVYIGRAGFSTASNRERWRTLASSANIHVFSQADPAKLAAYLAEFDVCTMPFLDLPMTRIMNAVKIYEYLAAGKPVVIPDIAELRPLAERGLIATYRDYEHSFQLLEKEIQTPPAPEQTAARWAFAAQNTWAERVDELVAAFSTLSHPRLNSSSGTALEVKLPVDVREIIQCAEE